MAVRFERDELSALPADCRRCHVLMSEFRVAAMPSRKQAVIGAVMESKRGNYVVQMLLG